jgi:hypothetical protein
VDKEVDKDRYEKWACIFKVRLTKPRRIAIPTRAEKEPETNPERAYHPEDSGLALKMYLSFG